MKFTLAAAIALFVICGLVVATRQGSRVEATITAEQLIRSPPARTAGDALKPNHLDSGVSVVGHDTEDQGGTHRQDNADRSTNQRAVLNSNPGDDGLSRRAAADPWMNPSGTPADDPWMNPKPTVADNPWMNPNKLRPDNPLMNPAAL